VRVRVFVSSHLSFKVAAPSESKVICALSVHNMSLPIRANRAIREIEEFMPSLMAPKIALSIH
jgi:hypothetical protein